MRKGGGKGKGSAFERTVAKLIVKAFRRHGIEQRECWRSVLSGGHLISCGDLAMSDRLLELFPYAVECKFRRRVRWERFLLGYKYRRKAWEEMKWIEQAEEGASKRKGLFPILVVKENRGPIYVLHEFDDGPIMETFAGFLREEVNCDDNVERLKKGAA